MKKAFVFILTVSSIYFSGQADCVSPQKTEGRVVRVAIIDDRDKLSLSLKGRYGIYAMDAARPAMEGPYLNADVQPAGEGLKFGDKEISLSSVRIRPAKDANIYINGRRFRGEVDIIRKENGKLMVINRIGVEDYLYGVLYNEVSHRWPVAALKAQAIVSRTFALNQAAGTKLQPYDLRCDIYSQVYGGKTSEKWITTRAVNLTRGEVLTYKGKVFPSYFHATCAGHTEDASNLWNVDLAPLKGVSCGFCRKSRHYRWRKEIPVIKLGDDLKKAGYNMDKVESVSVLSRNASGRVNKLEIKNSAGVSVIMTAKDFRQMVGPNEARSTNFDASIKGGVLVLDGFGWGHGVGMCQWGAARMARRGKTVEEILEYYYPGAKIEKLY